MLIGVIADTHDRLPERVAAALLQDDIDEIWHLGDVASPAILAPLQAKKLLVVRGNCDACMDWHITLDLVREKLRFRLIHIPPPEPPPDVDVVLHGHTHVPRDEMIQNVRFLNPGAVSRANQGAPPSYAMLEFADGAIQDWRIIRL